MSEHTTTITTEGDKTVYWQGARIGTCGEPVDTVRLCISRCRAIPDLIIGFDGERDGWVVSVDRGDELVEAAFIPESGVRQEVNELPPEREEFFFGVTGRSVPGYRVEEREGAWAVAHASNGREYLISKTKAGWRLLGFTRTPNPHGDTLRFTGETVEVMAT